MLREWTQSIWLHLCAVQEWSERLTLQCPRNLICLGQWKNEERTETQKIWDQLGLILWWRPLRAPDLTCSLYTIEPGSRAIAYSWMRRQAYLISAWTVRRDTVFRGKKPWWALSAYTVDRPEVGFASPMSLTWRKLWTPMVSSRYLRPGHGPALVNIVDTRDFPWSFQLIYVDGNHKSS